MAVIASLICTISAHAHDFEVDGIYYNITSDTELTAEVTFEGSSYASSKKTYADSVVIPSTVKHGNKTYNVTSIGERAFFQCEKVKDIVVPNSVTTINPYAFHTCINLRSVILPNAIDKIDNYLFQNDSSLVKVNLNENIKSIGNRAFFGCTSLTEIGNTDGVTFIDQKAFTDTKWLEQQPIGMLYIGKVLYCYHGALTADTAIVIKDGTTSIACNAFDDSNTTPEYITSISIPSSVTSIGNYAFYKCSNIESITIPEGITEISYAMFGNCYSLENVTLPQSLKSIGDYAFYECSAFEEFTIPANVTEIGNYAFYKCSNIPHISIPKSVTSVGKMSFMDCYSLEDITFEGEISNVGADAFRNTIWYESYSNGVVYLGSVLYEYKGEMPNGTNIVVKDGTTMIASKAFTDRTELAGITLPTTLRVINEYAFQGCSALKEITLPEGLASISRYAFKECTALKSIELPNSLDSIGTYVFEKCTGLTKATVGSGLKALGSYTFRGCKNLASITFAEGIKIVGNNCFESCSGLTEVTLPNSVTKINKYSFKACTNLHTLTAGTGLETVENYIFSGCDNVRNIYFMCATPPATTGELFSNDTNYTLPTLYVPKGTASAYKSADIWKKFKYIKEHDLTAIDNIESANLDVEITDGAITLNAAEGKSVTVYTFGGKVVERTDNYSGERIMLDKGCYIINIDNKAIKVKL